MNHSSFLGYFPRCVLKIIAATNHVPGSVAQKIDVLSFLNNGEPYEMADDAIILMADVCVGGG